MWFLYFFLGRWWLRTGANSFDSFFFFYGMLYQWCQSFLLLPVARGLLMWSLNEKCWASLGEWLFDLNGSLSTFCLLQLKSWYACFMMVCRAGRPIIRPQMLPYFACCIANKASHLETSWLGEFSFVMHCQDQKCRFYWFCFRHVRNHFTNFKELIAHSC